MIDFLHALLNISIVKIEYFIFYIIIAFIIYNGDRKEKINKILRTTHESVAFGFVVFCVSIVCCAYYVFSIAKDEPTKYIEKALRGSYTCRDIASERLLISKNEIRYVNGEDVLSVSHFLITESRSKIVIRGKKDEDCLNDLSHRVWFNYGIDNHTAVTLIVNLKDYVREKEISLFTTDLDSYRRFVKNP